MGQTRVTLTPGDATRLRFELARLRSDRGCGGTLDAHLLSLVRHVLKHDASEFACPRAYATGTDALVLETDALRVRLQFKSQRRMLVLEWSALLSPATKRVKKL